MKVACQPNKCNRLYLVDQVTGGGGLARVDVANDDNVDMSLFLSHGAWLRVYERL